MLTLVIPGDSGNAWATQRENALEAFFAGRDIEPDDLVIIDQDDGWRLFMKGINPVEVCERFLIEETRNRGI